MRKVLIYSRKKLNIPKNIKNNLTLRNVKVTHLPVTKDSNSRLELYGYDGGLKYKSRKVAAKTLKTVITKIDKMPIGSIELRIRKMISKK